MSSVACAATQTPKLYPDDEQLGSQFEDTQDSYMTLYEDTFLEDDERILARVQQYPIKRALSKSIGEAGTEKLFEVYDATDVIRDFCALGVPGEKGDDPETRVSYAEFFSKEEQLRVSQTLRTYCEQERGLVRLQNTLARQNSTRGGLADTREDDMPFDLIQTLDSIDILLFGEKAEEGLPHPSYAFPQEYYEGDADERTELGEEQAEQLFLEAQQESWQDEREESSGGGAGKNRSEYDQKDSSVTGNLAGLKLPLTDLNNRSLQAGCTTHNLGEPTQMHYRGNGGIRHMQSDVGEMFDVHATPTKDHDVVPQVEKVLKEINGELVDKPSQEYDAFARDIVTRSDCSEVVLLSPEDGESSTVSFRTVEACEAARRQEYNALLSSFEQERMTKELNFEWEFYSTMLDAWNQTFESFLDQVTDIQETFGTFRKKPQKI